jgi:SAM-dependent methyltransferase
VARLITEPFAENAPEIERNAVKTFFERRATKYGTLGPLQTVIYQDKNPELAQNRDAAEKALLRPKLDLSPDLHVLDIGCGTGRWVDEVAPRCAVYHGTDFSPGLIEIARASHTNQGNASFSVCRADQLTLAAIDASRPFDRIMMLGLLIYLNDGEAKSAIEALNAIAADSALILVREPVGIGARLTIKEHFSDDMEQTYNAIYRTEGELRRIFADCLDPRFTIVESGDVFQDQSLNNRTDTKQRWFLIKDSK